MISAISSTPQTSATTQSDSGSGTAALTSDFETFLLLLTTQAQNQDPLEPIDSSEYAAQLAQFSMVEQQVQTNDLLSELTAAFGGSNLDQLASWVGMDVQTTAAFQFDSTPVTLSANGDPNADSAVMVIRNANGEVVDRISVSVGTNEFTWAGVDDAGNPMPAGAYSASLESYQGEELVSQTPASTYSTVVEAQINGGAIVLTLDSGAEILTDDVSGVRAGA
ncbi:flagellar hook capping FlgD N-terminal domain-containing protein [Ruegeria sp.]|uniref:flagellar hook capping FlgD N-terminal domain-containing protein n=1 Tax=Ruegeria sp. TaxID=1879320 RepID=UPI00231F4C5F|nr:flagellar hook capping FlgD N-terminal domain-containing protein [Ruegeria sp.]MDA7964564.1 flagellar biosynthesis protein FlgD [Ruegeria sp.]